MSVLLDRASRALDLRPVRFILVGALNTAFGYGLFAALLFSGLPYPLAVLIASVLGTLFNFRSLGALVFADRSHKRLARFVAVYAIVYLISVALLRVADLARVNLYLASAALMPLTTTISYGLQKTYVFPAGR